MVTVPTTESLLPRGWGYCQRLNPSLVSGFVVRQDSNLLPPLGTERACNLRTRLFLSCSALPMSYAPKLYSTC